MSGVTPEATEVEHDNVVTETRDIAVSTPTPGLPCVTMQMSHHEGKQLFHLSFVHCPGLGSVHRRVDSTIALHILPLTGLDTW